MVLVDGLAGTSATTDEVLPTTGPSAMRQVRRSCTALSGSPTGCWVISTAHGTSYERISRWVSG